MSEDQLYAIAQQRIDRNTRRFVLLGVNFFAFLLFVAAFAGLGIVPSNVGKFVAIAWMGVIILHVILLFVMQYRKEAIESEVENLRREIYGEKPKRLELGEDGELVDDRFEADLELANKRRGDSV
jgi:uncharacterized membrane protein